MEVVSVVGQSFLEGPAWRPGPGDLLVTSVTTGTILRVDVGTGGSELFATTDGGPNGAWPATDGGLLVTQNGGLDWAAMGFSVPAGAAPTTPGLQRVTPEGSVRALTTGSGPFRAPNDLFATADGTVWFTDPPRFPPPAEPVGRIWRRAADGDPEVVVDGLVYPNGIGVQADGTVVIVEGIGSAGLLQLGSDGADRAWLIEALPHGGDGFAFDLDGNISVAGGGAVTVVSPAGEVLEVLEAPGEGTICTNCCFGGDDLRTLFVTDGSGRVLAATHRPVAGRPLDPVEP